MRRELADEIRFYSFVQFLFNKQWTALRAYANKNGIKIKEETPELSAAKLVELLNGAGVI